MLLPRETDETFISHEFSSIDNSLKTSYFLSKNVQIPWFDMLRSD